MAAFVDATSVIVVRVRVAIFDAQGAQLSEPAETSYLHGGYGGLMEGLERALEGKAAGEMVRVQLEPEDAFGDYDEELLRVEDRGRFPEALEIGMRFEGEPGGAEEGLFFTGTDIADERAYATAPST